MANLKLNNLIKSRQKRIMTFVGLGLFFFGMLIIALLADAKPKKHSRVGNTSDLTGIINESFTDANAVSAMSAQQNELATLKTQISELSHTLKELQDSHKQEAKDLAQKIEEAAKIKSVATPGNEARRQFIAGSQASVNGIQAGLWHNNEGINRLAQKVSLPARIHMVSFRKTVHKKPTTRLNPNHYVPSNTSVRAIILGGADADASVNGQSKNNGVMLFKFLEDGTLPNGQRSRLRGCRVSGTAYGDISSERAFATLYKISCAHPGEPIIDKEVTGWVFFNGKAGVKGVPLMRDNKIMQWAGVSGMMSGIASAAQYAQSVQSISSFGAASIVPQSNIGPYAAYGGASKAADVLSQYYVKRAEQYHPVIQVGSGNVVTIVFKDGFYLEPDDVHHSQNSYQKTRPTRPMRGEKQEQSPEGYQSDVPNFTVPNHVLNEIDNASNQSFDVAGVQP